MTDVNKTQTNKISTPRDARSLYGAAPASMTGKIGTEVEMALFDPASLRLQSPEAETMLFLHKTLKKKGQDVQLEASGVLEYASPAMTVSAIGTLIGQVKKDLSLFEQVSLDEGLSRSPFCILPTTTLRDSFQKKISRERLDMALAAIPNLYGETALRTPLLTTGVQASFSPQGWDEVFDMTRRGYALTPLLIACMNSSSGFIENETTRKDFHLRSHFYNAHKAAGGIATSFLRSADASEFLDNHIEMVFNTPMYFACNPDGSLTETIQTFRDLVTRGLGTQTNYELAESFLYNDVKICNLRDGETTIGKRVEIRAADSGTHQPISTLLLTAALIPNGPSAHKLDDLLREYGFTGNPVVDAPLLLASRNAAVYHNGQFMDVAFGNGRLLDFARDVATLLDEHYEATPDIKKDLTVLTDILRTGSCDAKRFAEKFTDLESICRSLRIDNTQAPVRRRVPALS